MRTLYRHEIAEEVFSVMLGGDAAAMLSSLERVKAVKQHCGGMLWDVPDRKTLAKWIATAGY